MKIFMIIYQELKIKIEMHLIVNNIYSYYIITLNI
jgi:hypothetical protein